MNELRQKAYSTLRKSERYFKTDMVYLAQGGFWLTLLQVLSSLASFILAVGFAHFLTKDTYGTYKYILSIGAVIASLSLTGLTTAVTKSVAEGNNRALTYAWKKNLVWSGPMLAVFAAAAGYYFFHDNKVLAYSLIVIGIITPLLSSMSLSDALFIGKKDFKKSSLTSAIATIFICGATLVAAYLKANVFILIIIYMLSSLAAETFIYLYARKSYPEEGTVDPQVMNYGAHLSAINVLNILIDRFDSILTFHFLGPISLAVYSFAVAIPEQIKGFSKNISLLALPKFSEDTGSNQSRGLIRKMLLMSGVASIIIIIYILSAPLLFKVFFPLYSGRAVFYSQIYSISLITVSNILPITLLQAQGSKRALYLFNIISGLFQLIVMVIGILMGGILGLIIAISISRFFRLGYSLFLVRD